MCVPRDFVDDTCFTGWSFLLKEGISGNVDIPFPLIVRIITRKLFVTSYDVIRTVGRSKICLKFYGLVVLNVGKPQKGISDSLWKRNLCS